MAICAARGAAEERHHGISDSRTVAAWACWEHACCSAAAILGDPEHPPEQFRALVEMICSCAWGAANERKFGKDHQEAQNSWERFHAHADAVTATECVPQCATNDLKWLVFNVSWSVVNALWYGT